MDGRRQGPDRRDGAPTQLYLGSEAAPPPNPVARWAMFSVAVLCMGVVAAAISIGLAQLTMLVLGWWP